MNDDDKLYDAAMTDGDPDFNDNAAGRAEAVVMATLGRLQPQSLPKLAIFAADAAGSDDIGMRVVEPLENHAVRDVRFFKPYTAAEVAEAGAFAFEAARDGYHRRLVLMLYGPDALSAYVDKVVRETYMAISKADAALADAKRGLVMADDGVTP